MANGADRSDRYIQTTLEASQIAFVERCQCFFVQCKFVSQFNLFHDDVVFRLCHRDITAMHFALAFKSLAL
jgi:hypothetical protein